MKPYALLFLFLAVSCEDNREFNELTIKTLSYKNDDKYPTIETDCYLRVFRLQTDGYDFKRLIFDDTLRSSEVVLTPEPGHIGFYAEKGGKSMLCDINYIGTVQINLVLK